MDFMVNLPPEYLEENIESELSKEEYIEKVRKDVLTYYEDSFNNFSKIKKNDINIKEDNIMAGADIPSLLITISSLLFAIFSVGPESIKEKGNEWKEAIKSLNNEIKKSILSFKNFFNKFRNEYKNVRISKDVADLVCRGYILEKFSDNQESLDKLELLDTKSISVNDIQGDNQQFRGRVEDSELSSRPFSIYFNFYNVNNSKIIVIGINSVGNVLFEYSHPFASHYDFMR